MSQSPIKSSLHPDRNGTAIPFPDFLDDIGCCLRSTSLIDDVTAYRVPSMAWEILQVRKLVNLWHPLTWFVVQVTTTGVAYVLLAGFVAAVRSFNAIIVIVTYSHVCISTKSY